MPTPSDFQDALLCVQTLHAMGHATVWRDIAQACESICHGWLDDHLDDLKSEELLSLRNACREADERYIKQTTLKRPRSLLTTRLSDEIARRPRPVL
jgi:hypothetical protein